MPLKPEDWKFRDTEKLADRSSPLSSKFLLSKRAQDCSLVLGLSDREGFSKANAYLTAAYTVSEV